jgi:hypothetical protein
MRMAVGDDVAAGEGSSEALRTSTCVPAIVDEPDPQALRGDDGALGEKLAERRLVHVSVHGLNGGELTELFQHGRGREVAHVQDQVGPLQHTEASLGEAARAARKVRVAEKRDQGAPSRKRPSR